jgi:hypothetical protein
MSDLPFTSRAVYIEPGREIRGNRNGERVCTYDQRDTKVLTNVSVYPDDRAGFDSEYEAVKQHDPDAAQVPGIGEVAFRQRLRVRWRVFGQYQTVPSEPSVPNVLLGRLVGFHLSSVQFVMDYVQLRFDGPTEDMPVLTCDVHPKADEVPGPEIALLNGFKDGHWMCWRPGEDSFEDLA